MPLTIGINHVTTVTADLDRLVRFYCEMFSAEKVFEGRGHPRMAIVEVGGTRYVKIVEGSSSRSAVERFGLAVGSFEELCGLRERMILADGEVGEIERLPTQWVMEVVDPDGGLLQVCAHAAPSEHDR